MILSALRFVVAFTGASFLVSLLSWSQGGAIARPALAIPALAVHMTVHAFYGAVAGLPTRRRDCVAAMAVAAMLIDVDHLGFYLGWPVPTRASHSLLFLCAAPVLLVMVARAGLLGRTIRPRLAGSMAFSIVLAHLAWDMIAGGEANMPFLLPFSTARLPTLPSVIPILAAIALQTAAVGTMWWSMSRRAPAAPRSAPARFATAPAGEASRPQ